MSDFDEGARVAKNLKVFREQLGWTQAEAAKWCDVNIDMFRDIEAGRKAIIPATIVRMLAKGMGLRMEDFFEERPVRADISRVPPFTLLSRPQLHEEIKDHAELISLVDELRFNVKMVNAKVVTALSGKPSSVPSPREID